MVLDYKPLIVPMDGSDSVLLRPSSDSAIGNRSTIDASMEILHILYGNESVKSDRDQENLEARLRDMFVSNGLSKGEQELLGKLARRVGDTTGIRDLLREDNSQVKRLYLDVLLKRNQKALSEPLMGKKEAARLKKIGYIVSVP
jgi:hypothetical protein